MRPNPGNIEIQEPPLQELNKKRSCVKRSCATGCGCLAIVILAIALLVKLAANPPQKELSLPPPSFPADIPVYDKDAIHGVVLVSGKSRSRWSQPAFSLLEKGIGRAASFAGSGSAAREWLEAVGASLEDRRDSIRVEWKDLTAEPGFVERFYKNELAKSGYAVSDIKGADPRIVFSFQKDAVDGTLVIVDNPDRRGTDDMTIVIRVPSAD